MEVALALILLAIFVFIVVFGESLLQLQRRRHRLHVPSSKWEYDVFLSFRGEDTRRGFISHLYRALSDKGIRTFFDVKELPRGKIIWSGLAEGIQASRVAIVVLSENYASSSWCLEELSLISECFNNGTLKLIPVFYGIDPSHVKKQTGSFAEAFRKHESKNDKSKMVKKWRKALTQVGNVSGWDSRNWSDESTLIRVLVRDLLKRVLSPLPPINTRRLVGMSSHMRNLKSLLCLDSEDVRTVGICGMSGVGKSTVAKFVYDSLSSSFEGACLLENVKESFRQSGPSHLRNTILSMCRRKVLIVLDGVDNIEQLKQLARSRRWFGPGSRIIVTTQDKRVLHELHVEYIYEVKPLKTPQALRLFSEHAFRQPLPREGFMKHSIQVVEQLGGLPLALKAVGKSLYQRDIAFWEDRMSRKI